jgi:hypothetical protein
VDIGTTSDYSAIANPHNSQFTTATAKPFPTGISIIRSLATASNSGGSSSSSAQVISPTLVQNYLAAIPSTETDYPLCIAQLHEALPTPGTQNPILRCNCQVSSIIFNCPNRIENIVPNNTLIVAYSLSREHVYLYVA